MSSEVVRIAVPIAVRTVAAQRELSPVALFSGIGVLVLILAALTGVQGVWY